MVAKKGVKRLSKETAQVVCDRCIPRDHNRLFVFDEVLTDYQFNRVEVSIDFLFPSPGLASRMDMNSAVHLPFARIDYWLNRPPESDPSWKIGWIKLKCTSRRNGAISSLATIHLSAVPRSC